MVTPMVVGGPERVSTASGAISAGRNVVLLKERVTPRVAGWGIGIVTVSAEPNDPSRLAYISSFRINIHLF